MKWMPIVVGLYLFCLPSHTQAALNDIEYYPNKSSVELLEARGVISGYPDGSFRPYSAINRAEFLKILMLSVFGSQVQQGAGERCFGDFTTTYEWYWTYACSAKALGIIHGYPDGTFRGTDTIILAEALKMALEAWQVPLEADDSSHAWYTRYMNAAAQKGVFKRFPYEPDYVMTRGEMALLFVLLKQPIATLNGDAQQSSLDTVTVPLPIKKAVCGNGIVEGAEQCDDGNIENNDGCSKICVIVEEPIRHGTLRIEQQVISGTSQASGNDNVPLFRFTAIAGRQDVYLTNLRFTTDAGSLQFAQNYRLLVDMDGDGVVESLFGTAAPSGASLTFSDLNVLVQDGRYRTMEIWADMQTSFSAKSLALAFDVAKTDVVEGVDKTDGEDVSGVVLNDNRCTLESICWIRIITGSAQAVEINTRGNLYVTQSDTIGSRQLLAGTTTPSLLLLKLRADAEPIAITSLAIENVPSSVEHLEFLTAGSSVPFAIGRIAQCASVSVTRFCTSESFTIAKGTEQLIIVRAVLNSDDYGAVSGQSLALSISSSASARVAIEAEGAQSGQPLSQNDGDTLAEGEIFIGTSTAGANAVIAGPSHTVVLAKIADIANSSIDADGAVFSEGGIDLGRFAFRAAANNNFHNGLNSAEISKLVFSVSAVNVSMDAAAFHLYNSENASAISACSASATTGTITVTCENLDSSSANTGISQGDTIHLVLHGSVSDAQIEHGISILQTSLQNLSNPSVTGTITWTDGETTYSWVDIGKTTVRSTNYRLE